MTTDQKKTLKFIKLIDQAKYVKRVVHLQKERVMEDDAQHSWHVAMMVWLFSQSFEEEVNLERAIKMALAHDLVEIYAGDVFFYDSVGRKDKKKKERKAAKKLFNLLPDKLQKELLDLWEEYEQKSTPEAKFVQAMDKIHPIIQLVLVKGKTWQKKKITEKILRENKTPYTLNSQFLINLLNHLLKEARKNNYFYKD